MSDPFHSLAPSRRARNETRKICKHFRSINKRNPSKILDIGSFTSSHLCSFIGHSPVGSTFVYHKVNEQSVDEDHTTVLKNPLGIEEDIRLFDNGIDEFMKRDVHMIYDIVLIPDMERNMYTLGQFASIVEFADKVVAPNGLICIIDTCDLFDITGEEPQYKICVVSNEKDESGVVCKIVAMQRNRERYYEDHGVLPGRLFNKGRWSHIYNTIKYIKSTMVGFTENLHNPNVTRYDGILYEMRTMHHPSFVSLMDRFANIVSPMFTPVYVTDSLFVSKCESDGKPFFTTHELTSNDVVFSFLKNNIKNGIWDFIRIEIPLNQIVPSEDKGCSVYKGDHADGEIRFFGPNDIGEYILYDSDVERAVQCNTNDTNCKLVVTLAVVPNSGRKMSRKVLLGNSIANDYKMLDKCLNANHVNLIRGINGPDALVVNPVTGKIYNK